jgi:hypothetical protein
LDGLRSADLVFNVSLFFRGERLNIVSLMGIEPCFSWEDHSEEKEYRRKVLHDAWLAGSLGRRRRYPWGTVWSGYDERGGYSSIDVRYLTDA